MTDFDSFWAAYPRKTAKVLAGRAFDRAIRSTTLPVMLAAIEQQIQSDQWRRGFIPHPATWLRQERWLDELPLPRPATAFSSKGGARDTVAVDEALRTRQRRQEMVEAGMDPEAVEAVFEREYLARKEANR
jgi:hypothetical protein